ncbi:unnamed protein product [Pseudo-nitzschia multistriata]|uniref:RxLR effector protein n=1 Tax=Pseudo-nitzschia multistriata TaxID=183589 RepID=A0A448Z585_9STRA|nr:unnamed protein product [Pseudo-nitzschia multistriata]
MPSVIYNTRVFKIGLLFILSWGFVSAVEHVLGVSETTTTATTNHIAKSASGDTAPLRFFAKDHTDALPLDLQIEPNATEAESAIASRRATPASFGIEGKVVPEEDDRPPLKADTASGNQNAYSATTKTTMLLLLGCTAQQLLL